jgi:cytochrome c-type protein NapC
MDFTLQDSCAAEAHLTALTDDGDETCIDCHKGIAHELPDMADVRR